MVNRYKKNTSRMVRSIFFFKGKACCPYAKICEWTDVGGLGDNDALRQPTVTLTVMVCALWRSDILSVRQCPTVSDSVRQSDSPTVRQRPTASDSVRQPMSVSSSEPQSDSPTVVRQWSHSGPTVRQSDSPTTVRQPSDSRPTAVRQPSDSCPTAPTVPTVPTARAQPAAA